jgi:alpha-N-arabinofuranosidase
MYLPFQDARFVPVTLDAGIYREGDLELPRVDGIAARDADGRLWLAVTNVDPDRKATVAATFDGMVARSARGEVLTGPQVNSVNTFDKPDVVVTKPISGTARNGGIILELPPKSIAVVQVVE